MNDYPMVACAYSALHARIAKNRRSTRGANPTFAGSMVRNAFIIN
jgi:predicted transcriptional regulator